MKTVSRKLLKITTAAVLMALTCVLTMAVRIPSPTKGYLNLGDSAVLLSGFLLGPVYGPIAGGVGSALADFLAGYPVYIPGTLVIKALMAWLIAVIPRLFRGKGSVGLRIGFLLASAAAELLMTAGYYLYEAAVIGEGFIPAIAGVSGNAVQGIAGAAAAYFLVELFSRTGIARICGAQGFVPERNG